jgi:capsular polysaccharide biosynthesis protein
MYGGVLFGHFGHFLMDSLARIWAMRELRDKIDGVVFTPKNNGGNLEHMLNVQRPLMQALGMDCEVKVLTAPTRVDQLFVPWQGIGIGDNWEIATPEYRAYMADFGGKAIEPEGHDKIYVSRSALPRARASFLSEKLIEKHLEAAGYTVIHPQKMSKEEQIAQYRKARWIVSPDGSPMHLLAYVGHKDQHVAVIARRSSVTNLIFESQIGAFTGARAITINCLSGDWLPGGKGRPGRMSWGELDMEALYHGLNDAGFLPEGTAPWPKVTDEELAAEIAEISEREGVEFGRLNAPAQNAV